MIFLLLHVLTCDSPFASTIQGVSLRAEASTGIYGLAITGNLGLTSIGAREFSPRWLLEWNGEAAATGGVVAYEYPFYPLYGARAVGEGDALFRFLRGNAWSLALDVGTQTSASAIGLVGIAKPNDLDTLSNFFNTDWRAGLGGVWQHGRHLLVFSADAEMEYDSPESNTPQHLFFGGALHARYDWQNSVMANGEAYLGGSVPDDDKPLGLSQQTNRWLLSFSVTKNFGTRKWHHWFLDAGATVSRDETNSSYSGVHYVSDASVVARLSLGGGYSF